jgi:hypothetical protein
MQIFKKKKTTGSAGPMDNLLIIIVQLSRLISLYTSLAYVLLYSSTVCPHQSSGSAKRQFAVSSKVSLLQHPRYLPRFLGPRNPEAYRISGAVPSFIKFTTQAP